MPGYPRTKLSALNRLHSLQNRSKRPTQTRQLPLCHLTTPQAIRDSMVRIAAEMDSLSRQISCISYTQDHIETLNQKLAQHKKLFRMHQEKLAHCASHPQPSERPNLFQMTSAVPIDVHSPSALSVLPLLKHIRVDQEPSAALVEYDISSSSSSSDENN